MKLTATTDGTQSLQLAVDTKPQLNTHLPVAVQRLKSNYWIMRPTCQIVCHQNILMSMEKILKCPGVFSNDSDKLWFGISGGAFLNTLISICLHDTS